jgi:ribosome-associated protein
MIDGETLSRACAVAAVDKKAGNIVVLDLRGISTFTDYFVICSATSEPQLKAISSSIREQVREQFGRKPISEDGYPASQWVILDYGDVIVHLFQGDKREFYSLESLWSDAKRVTLEA